MFAKISHFEGLKVEDEILFSTSFNYLFPDAARSRQCLLPGSESTLNALNQLGQLMADPGDINRPQPPFDSTIPAIFTYFGQFIDHDITARIDRDGALSELGMGEPVFPIDPDIVVNSLRNGRRPQLDLDSVFGEGPGLVGSAVAQSQILYDAGFRVKVFCDGTRVDLPRDEVTHKATIADMRNDENVNLSQLHSAFLKFYNAVHDRQSGTARQRYVRSRQLVRWAYQLVVVNDYLMTVCDEHVVKDTLANGPRFIGLRAGKGDAFVPLEFSAAAFRFGHSMIRPFYQLNSRSGKLNIVDLLGPDAKPANFDVDGQLRSNFIVDWTLFAGDSAQKARRIDTKIAQGLFMLPMPGRRDPVLAHLARSNLLRAYSMSIPTGQAVCEAFGVHPLTTQEIHDGEDPAIAELLRGSYLDRRTPLWYYILREAAVQQNGNRLGEIGSRLVAETMIGLLKQDPNSYLNNLDDPAVSRTSVDIEPGLGCNIRKLTDILEAAGVASF